MQEAPQMSSRLNFEALARAAAGLHLNHAAMVCEDVPGLQGAHALSRAGDVPEADLGVIRA